MISIISSGILLGFSAGISPGPLLALVVAETVRHGVTAGIRVALAPLVTDLPIVLITVLLVNQLSRFHHVLGIISLAGGILVLYLGVERLWARTAELDTGTAAPRSLLKGVAVNAISPHPYLFWFSVGSPILLKAWNRDPWQGILFLLSFYCLLVGSKVGIALLVNRSRAFLQGNVYRTVMQLLGLILIGFSFFLFQEGLVLLDVV